MSTNYYAIPTILFPLSFTVNSLEQLKELADQITSLTNPIHLGKKSNGWKFLGSWNDGAFYSNYQSYINFINQPDIEIYDEYDNKLTKEEFISIVTTWKGKRATNPDCIKFPELDFLSGYWC